MTNNSYKVFKDSLPKIKSLIVFFTGHILLNIN